MTPPKIAQLQIDNQSEIYTKANRKTIELFTCIPKYIEAQRSGKILHRSVKYYNPKTTNENLIPLSQEWINNYNLYSEIKDKYNKNKAFNKALKELIGLEVLAEVDNQYIVSPYYFTSNSNKYVDICLKWQIVTGKKLPAFFFQNCVYEYSGNHKILDNANIQEINILIQNNTFIYNP